MDFYFQLAFLFIMAAWRRRAIVSIIVTIEKNGWKQERHKENDCGLGSVSDSSASSVRIGGFESH